MFSSCILIPILVGLLSALLGYLLGRMFSSSGGDDNSARLQADLDACRSHSSKLQAEISDLESQVASLKASGPSGNAAQPLSAMGVTAAAAIPFDSGLATGVFGKTVKEDDLKIVEGIGPKTEELFHNAGIRTWKALAETSLENCQKVLQSGGERFSLLNPGTWPRQAELAWQGKWQELKDWQDSMDSGKE